MILYFEFLGVSNEQVLGRLCLSLLYHLYYKVTLYYNAGKSMKGRCLHKAINFHTEKTAVIGHIPNI